MRLINREDLRSYAIDPGNKTHLPKLVCCCTSTDKSKYLPGTWIEKKSEQNKSTKFRKSTFISYDNIISLHNEAILYKRGSCPEEIIEEIKKHISDNNLS